MRRMWCEEWGEFDDGNWEIINLNNSSWEKISEVDSEAKNRISFSQPNKTRPTWYSHNRRPLKTNLMFAWHPAPFQSPGIGLGSKLITTLNSSATLWSIHLEAQRWSPISIPSQGPTWYSHWGGIWWGVFSRSFFDVLRKCGRLLDLLRFRRIIFFTSSSEDYIF